MDTQNYKKNIASYADVVNAGRVARRLEFLANEFDRLLKDLAIVVGDSKVPECSDLFQSQIWSLQLKADKKYSELFQEHVANMKGE